MIKYLVFCNGNEIYPNEFDTKEKAIEMMNLSRKAFPNNEYEIYTFDRTLTKLEL